MKPYHLTLALMLSCSTIYYNFWETMGKEKRDLLQSNMRSAQEEQTEVKDKFESTLSKIRHEYSFKEGDLEETYDELKSDYEEALDKKEALSSRIDKVDDLAEDLFDEWEDEADELNNKKYRSESKKKLKRTQKRFTTSLKSMRDVEAKLESVLSKFKDRVVYLKHNLNAKMIGNFRNEFKNIEKEMRGLMKEINASNKKAESFIRELE